ncbi:helix-turn-helix domain-containing protein [Patescibacteria group bacterium]
MDKNLKILISRRIKKSLNEAKISQTQLAGVINKSRAYVSNITKGRYTPKVTELQKIAHYVNKPLGYFFGEDSSGLMHFIDKAKKWDKMVSLIDRDIKEDVNGDVIQVPLVSPSDVKTISPDDLNKLVKQTKKFIPISTNYIKNVLKYYKAVENLVAVNIFIRDYPSFGLEVGDMIIVEPIDNNDIKEEYGKLYALIYKNTMGLKRIYKDGNEFYFEPMNSDPIIDKVNVKDPNLIIVGKVIFSFNIKVF